MYYHPARSNSVSPVDANYAFLDHGSEDYNYYEYMSFYHHETNNIVDKADGAVNPHRILITKDLYSDSYRELIYPAYSILSTDPNPYDYVTEKIWINKCTDCVIFDNSQYTNGPWSPLYATHDDISTGVQIHVAFDIRMSGTDTTHYFLSGANII
jgi:hypothetical protein